MKHILLIFPLLLLFVLKSSNKAEGNFNSDYPSKVNSTIDFNPNFNSINEITENSVFNKQVRCIFQDQKGNYWFGTDGLGVCKYDGKSFQYFTKADGLCGNYIYTIIQDDFGNMWFAGRDGVCTYNGIFFYDFSSKTGLRSAPFHCSLKDKKGNIWFGTFGGYCKFNGSSFKYEALNRVDVNNDRNNSQFTIYSLLEDQLGNIWMGTELNGACKYDGKSYTYFKENGLNKASIRQMLQDKSGMIWFANNGGGLIKYNGNSFSNFTEEMKLSKLDLVNTPKNTKGNMNRVWSVIQDQSGKIWIGSYDCGIWIYDGKNIKKQTDKEGLTSNFINILFKDNQNKIWISTRNQGVFQFDRNRFVDLLMGGDGC